MGFRVWGLGFRVWGLGVRVWVRVEGLGVPMARFKDNSTSSPVPEEWN